MNRERQGIYTSQISFINGVRSYLDGVFCPKSKLFILRTTPSVWQYCGMNNKDIVLPYVVLVCTLSGGDVNNVEIWDKDRLHYVKQNALCVEYRFNKDLNRYFYKTSSAFLQIYKGTER